MCKQAILYLCNQMIGSIKEDNVKRGAIRKTRTKIAEYIFSRKGLEYFSELSDVTQDSSQYVLYDGLDWCAILDIVGIQNIAKKYKDNNNDVYYYGAMEGIKYEKDNHNLTLSYVGTRWDSETDIRHRNIPTLLDQYFENSN